MSDLRLESPAIQKGLRQLIGEARASARTPYCGGVLGCAAMSTIFCCVLAVGEALWHRADERGDRTGRWGTESFVRLFYQEMPDKESWLLPPVDAVHRADDVVGALEGTRNSLAHALAIPFDVVLRANRRAVPDLDEECWQLLVTEFVNAADVTILHLTATCPDLSFEAVVQMDDRRRGPLTTGPPSQTVEFKSTASDV